jgi:hypothetical protein
MNELEQIQSQLNEINNKRIKYQTLKDQAIKKCQEIEQKYGITSLEELQALRDKANLEYQASLQEAQKYIEETNKVFASYSGIL